MKKDTSKFVTYEVGTRLALSDGDLAALENHHVDATGERTADDLNVAVVTSVFHRRDTPLWACKILAPPPAGSPKSRSPYPSAAAALAPIDVEAAATRSVASPVETPIAVSLPPASPIFVPPPDPRVVAEAARIAGIRSAARGLTGHDDLVAKLIADGASVADAAAAVLDAEKARQATPRSPW